MFVGKLTHKHKSYPGNGGFCSNKYGVCLYAVCIVLQSEKAKLLMDHEIQKLQELDKQYESELSDWKQNLRYRKQVHLSLVMLKVKG